MSAPDADSMRRAWLQAVEHWDSDHRSLHRRSRRLPAVTEHGAQSWELSPEERRAWLDRIDPDHTLPRRYFVPRRCEVTIIDDLDCCEDDAHTVAFSKMSAEAEAELAAWDEMLHGRNR